MGAKHTCTLAGISCLIAISPTRMWSQSTCDVAAGDRREIELVGPTSDYARIGELLAPGRSTPRLARRLSNSMIAPCEVGPWHSILPYLIETKLGLTAIPFSMAMNVNSAYPNDRNNGSMWAGRGGVAV